MTVKYKTVITKAGAEKLAAATVPNGKKVNFTAMAVGDGGGTLPTPDASQTKLVNEVWRHTLNKISQDNKNKNYVVAELVIPPETGGFWLREMGLYDDTGTLIAVGNMAESYKPELAEGSGRAQTLRMVIMVSDIESVELAIDTTLVMATQDYVDDKLAEHEQSRRHPDASLTAKGFTQLSSATDSTSEVLAATPKAVKVVRDIADGKYTAQDATTARKGIVQLSSATDSTSEVLAATPKAVKTAYDLANGKYTAQDATTARKGIVQLSSATDSTSEVLAATPKAVKTAYDLANGKYTAQDATTAQKGIVQLSSSTDSTSEVLAATPKAVKSVSDELATVKKTLGNASGKDVVTSTADTTAGRVLTVGWMGLGAVSGLTATDANSPNYNCYFRMNADGIHGPVANAPSNIFQFQYDTNAGQQIGYRAGAENAPMYHRTKINGVWGNWMQVFDTAHPPTPAQVGAVNKYGDIVEGDLRVSGEIQATSMNSYRMVAGSYGTFWRQDGNNLYLMVTNSGDQYGGYNSLRPFAINLATGYPTMSRLGLSDFANFDARYYTKTLSDAGYMAKTNAYTKAESDGRFQPKGSYAAPDTAGVSGNVLWWKSTATGVIKMMGQTASVGNSGRVTFPFAFPNKCYGVVPTRNNESGQGAAMQPYSVDTTGWNLRIAGGGTETVMWTAMGH